MNADEQSGILTKEQYDVIITSLVKFGRSDEKIKQAIKLFEEASLSMTILSLLTKKATEIFDIDENGEIEFHTDPKIIESLTLTFNEFPDIPSKTIPKIGLN